MSVPAHTGTAVAMPVGRRFAPGFDPRRSAGGMTKAEQEWRRAIDEEHIPNASKLAHRVRREAIKAYRAGDPHGGAKNAELYFKLLGLIRKPSTVEEDGAKMGAAMMAFLEGLRAQKAAKENPDPPP